MHGLGIGHSIAQGLYGSGGAFLFGAPPGGTAGTAFSWTPTHGGGTPGYTFSITLGTLPTGLTLNTVTGTISGTPSAAGTSSGITLHMVDAAATALDLTGLSFVIAAGGSPAFSFPLSLSFMGY